MLYTVSTGTICHAHSHLSVVYRTVPQAAKTVLSGAPCAETTKNNKTPVCYRVVFPYFRNDLQAVDGEPAEVPKRIRVTTRKMAVDNELSKGAFTRSG